MSTELFYPVSADSLAFRANISTLISPLRRIRARVPFWQLAAHRIPTLWSLYRGLQREAPTDTIRWRIAFLFRQNRHITSVPETRAQLKKAYRWLDIFTRAHAGDERLRAILLRYDRMLIEKHKTEAFKQTLRQEFAWQHQLRHRPILIGVSFGPNISHGPLPRLKPQPIAISGMIRARLRARTRRQEKMSDLAENRDDLRNEAMFEEMLEKSAGVRIESVFRQSNEWDAPLRSHAQLIHQTFARDDARAVRPFPPELLEQLHAARRMRVENKTRERQRELRGEILPRTIRRRNKGPPAHVLRRMSPEQRVLDRVVRGSVSETGYIGMVKRRMGWKHSDKVGWRREIGKPEDAARLNKEVARVREENLRRRSRAARATTYVDDSA